MKVVPLLKQLLGHTGEGAVSLEVKPGDCGVPAFPQDLKGPAPTTALCSQVKFHTPLMCAAVPWAVSMPGGCQGAWAAACIQQRWPRTKGRSGTILAEQGEQGLGGHRQVAQRSCQPQGPGAP